MSNFTITIKSDEDGISYYIDPTPVKTADVIAALEVAKLMVWENKEPKEEAEKPAEADGTEMKIGEVRLFNGKKYRCVEGSDSPNCEGCAFDGPDCIIPFGDCAGALRKDGKDVIFVEVREDEK